MNGVGFRGSDIPEFLRTMIRRCVSCSSAKSRPFPSAIRGWLGPIRSKTEQQQCRSRPIVQTHSRHPVFILHMKDMF